MTMKRAVVTCALVFLSLASCGKAGPPQSRVEQDIKENLDDAVLAACGYMGSMSLNVNSVRDIRFRESGSGTATATVTNSTMFNEPRTCEINVRFRYVKRDGAWALQELKEVR